VILQLKTGVLDPEYFQRKFQTDILNEWKNVWRHYENEKLVRIGDDRIRLTRAGLLRADSLLPAFFEPEHQGVRYT
jgi:oxygen-independent coproporphyrinogen-3 oxidase